MVNPLQIANLHNAIVAVCPIVGVSIGDWSDKNTWRIDFDAAATPQQQSAATAVLTAFVPDTFVPPSITMLQFRKAVRAAGRTAQVVAGINSLAADMQEAWQFARVIRRNADFLLALQSAMSLSSAQVDNFFVQAATFPGD